MPVFGILYVVATPIGNLEDITLRALRIMREANIIAAEDTRVTRNLLSHFDIHTSLTSCHEHSTNHKIDEIIVKLTDGQTVALVSDAGMPGISDPGERLIREAIKCKIPVIPIPGANAALSSLIISGLPTERFSFYGFPPRTKTDRKQFFDELKNHPNTIILYESPRRLLHTLADIESHLGDIPVAIARELTKIHEDVFRGLVSEACGYYASHPLRGEITIVLHADSIRKTIETPSMRWEDRLGKLIEDGMRPVDAARIVSKECGVSRKMAYDFHIRHPRKQKDA